jgi:hypothetical protein
MTANTTTQCECQSWFFGNYGPDGSAESFEDYGTGCTQTTGRIFAQGHDAKLAGFLVRADLNGEEISKMDGGMRVTFAGAVEAAGSISQALGVKVELAMVAATARLAKRMVKQAKAQKAEKVEVEVAPEPATRSARIKVGRWEYNAIILTATGQATYASKLGATKTAEQGTYQEV